MQNEQFYFPWRGSLDISVNYNSCKTQSLEKMFCYLHIYINILIRDCVRIFLNGQNAHHQQQQPHMSVIFTPTKTSKLSLRSCYRPK